MQKEKLQIIFGLNSRYGTCTYCTLLLQSESHAHVGILHHNPCLKPALSTIILLSIIELWTASTARGRIADHKHKHLHTQEMSGMC